MLEKKMNSSHFDDSDTDGDLELKKNESKS